MKTRKPEVFVSATTGDLGLARQAVKEALLTLGCVPVEQTNFPPDHRTIREMLRKKIADCDAVIHLVGRPYGAEPKTRQPDEPRRSYTHLEYDVALELGKPVYTFVAAEGFDYGAGLPEEDEEKRRLQEAHRQAVRGTDRLFHDFAEPSALEKKVRELQVHVDELRRKLEEEAAQRARESRRHVRVALAVCVLLFLIGGGVFFAIRKLDILKGIENEQVDELAALRGQLEEIAGKVNAPKSGSMGSETLDAEAHYERALEEVARNHGIEPAALRARIETFVTAVEADAQSTLYDQALADFAQKHFAQAARKAERAGDERVARIEREQARIAEEKQQAIKEFTLAGQAHFADVEYRKALAAYRKAAALTDRVANPLGWAEAQIWVAFVLIQLAQHDEGIGLLEQIVEVRERELGPDDPKLAVALNNLAWLL